MEGPLNNNLGIFIKHSKPASSYEQPNQYGAPYDDQRGESVSLVTQPLVTYEIPT